MKKLLKIITFIWCLPQTLLAVILKTAYRAKPEKDSGVKICRYKSDFCFSLGEYLFIADDVDKDSFLFRHELGHTVQSRLLGPLYLPLIALPSMIWCHLFGAYRKKKGINYYSFYTEKWANRLSEKHYKKLSENKDTVK